MKRLHPIVGLVISFFVYFTSCKKSSDPCSGVAITLDATIENASSPTANDGRISANATGSTDLTFSLNNGAYQSSAIFINLKAGSYTITAKNGGGCTSSKSFTVGVAKVYFLTLNPWKFDNAKVGGTDVSALIQACQKDNIVTFSSNSTGLFDEGATKCNSGDPQTTFFTWSFMSNETILHVSTVLFTGGASDFTIVSLNDSQLVLSQQVNMSGTMQTVVVTYVH